MELVWHDEMTVFWRVAEPFYVADPEWHSVAITVARGSLASPDRPNSPILLTITDGGRTIGAALRTPPYSLLASGIPAAAADEVAQAWRAVDPELPGVSGPREQAEPFATTWAQHTGAAVHEQMAMRTFVLDTLIPPRVTGTARVATEEDEALLTEWCAAFIAEALPGVPQEFAADEVRRRFATGDGMLFWEAAGKQVSMAWANTPANGMSRISHVYTPPRMRGHGYGSAATTAATPWARQRGATLLMLNTDLSNPTSNSIYPKIGYRPVHDSVELGFSQCTTGLASSGASRSRGSGF